jgi:hypothetical protein
MCEMRNECIIFVRVPERKRPKHRCEDNIKMGFKEMGCDGVFWIHMAQDRVQWRALVKMTMKLRIP